MNGAEIIKELENKVNGSDWGGFDDADLLDLINRQKAEIEALRMDNQQLQSDIANANMNADHSLAEIERLTEENKKVSAYMGNGWGYVSFLEFVKNQRAEAIKEFAERLKEELNNVARVKIDDYDYYCVGLGFIDNLVKEMVGESNV